MPLVQEEQFVCDDDTFWQWKIQEDISIPWNNTQRFGLKATHRRLRTPRVYLWG